MSDQQATMNKPNLCPQCGTPLSVDASAAPCPVCLLQLGIEVGRCQFDADPASRPTEATGERIQPPSIEALQPLFPQFEFVRLLGSGGMGAVYLANQKALDRLVALKIIHPRAAANADFAERFSREARSLARLSHPNIVGVHDFGQISHPDNSHSPSLYYIVMEYVDGMNLRELSKSAPLTPTETLKIVPAICDALQFAHEQGIVHRDIKPENILLDRHGRVKIADFGLAKLVGQDPSERLLTGIYQAMGTPHYMAPEQMSRPNEVDHRADIYALGVTLYELLTGELPLGRFARPSQKVEVDVRMDKIVLRAMEQEPQRRYQHISEVRTDVESISSQPKAPTTQPDKGLRSDNDYREQRPLLRQIATVWLWLPQFVKTAVRCLLGLVLFVSLWQFTSVSAERLAGKFLWHLGLHGAWFKLELSQNQLHWNFQLSRSLLMGLLAWLVASLDDWLRRIDDRPTYTTPSAGFYVGFAICLWSAVCLLGLGVTRDVLPEGATIESQIVVRAILAMIGMFVLGLVIAIHFARQLYRVYIHSKVRQGAP